MTSPEIVKKIVKIQLNFIKENLNIIIEGEVPTAGYTNTILLKEENTGEIQNFKLLSSPPDKPSGQVISKVTAVYEWLNWKKDSPNLKIIRVLGEGIGIKEKLIQ